MILDGKRRRVETHRPRRAQCLVGFIVRGIPGLLLAVSVGVSVRGRGGDLDGCPGSLGAE